MARSTPEGKVKAAIKAYLNALGAFHRWPVSNGMGADQLDCYGCYKGRYFTIEAKRDDKPAKATPRQLAHIEKVKAAGGIAIVAKSADDVGRAFEAAGLPFGV
jgi:hypothetical protein